jgi:hypothetical protein
MASSPLEENYMQRLNKRLLGRNDMAISALNGNYKD